MSFMSNFINEISVYHIFVMRSTLVSDVYSCSSNMSWRNRVVDVQLEVFGTVEWLSHTVGTVSSQR